LNQHQSLDIVLRTSRLFAFQALPLSIDHGGARYGPRATLEQRARTAGN